MGLIKDGFHFLGVSYSQTQPENDTKVIYANDVLYLDNMGGVEATSEHHKEAIMRIVPHARTLRKARIQVQQMVTIGLSANCIRRYLINFYFGGQKLLELGPIMSLSTGLLNRVGICWIWPFSPKNFQLVRLRCPVFKTSLIIYC